MTLLHIRDFPQIKAKLTKEPKGDIIPMSWYRESVQYDLVCIHCCHRWSAAFPVEMTEKPQWMGQLECAHPECASKGTVICG